MKWLERYYGEARPKTQQEDPRGINLMGVVLLCNVLPSGNGPMTLRFLWRSLRHSWTITAGFVLKRALTDGAVCRELSFGGAENANGISDEDVGRYQGYFARDLAATIDLRDLAGRLPLRSRSSSGCRPNRWWWPPATISSSTARVRGRPPGISALEIPSWWNRPTTSCSETAGRMARRPS